MCWQKLAYKCLHRWNFTTRCPTIMEGLEYVGDCALNCLENNGPKGTRNQHFRGVRIKLQLIMSKMSWLGLILLKFFICTIDELGTKKGPICILSKSCPVLNYLIVIQMQSCIKPELFFLSCLFCVRPMRSY